MIAPIRTSYAHSIAGGSRVAAGARNVAKATDSPHIETSAESKRTGSQEESLLHDGGERREGAPDDMPQEKAAPAASGEDLTGLAHQSLALNERLRTADEAYRAILDQGRRQKTGEVFNRAS